MLFTIKCATTVLAVLAVCAVANIAADVIGHIKTLDYLVCNAIEHPQEGGGEKLSSDLLQLFIALDETHDKLRDEREAGKSIVQGLLDGGGMKLPSVLPDYPLVMKVFNWTLDESKAFGSAFKGAVKMWRKVEMGMEIVPTTEIDFALNPEKDK